MKLTIDTSLGAFLKTALPDLDHATARDLRAKIQQTIKEAVVAERAACHLAVALTVAPVTGTPYTTGPNKFCQAIKDMPNPRDADFLF